MLGYDFSVFWQAGRALLAGANPYAVPGYFYPPAAALVFALLSLVPFNLAFPLWSGLGAACYYGTLRRHGFGRRQALVWFFFAPFIFNLMVGQVDLPLFWLATFLPSGGWQAVLAGALITLKPQVALILLPWFAVRWLLRRPRLFAAWLAATLALHLGVLLFDPLIYGKWLLALPDGTLWRISSSPGLLALGNFGVPLWLLGLFGVFVAVWGFFHDERVCRSAIFFVAPMALWYDAVLLAGSVPWLVMLPISWLACALAVALKNSYPLAGIAAGFMFFAVLKGIKSSRAVPSP